MGLKLLVLGVIELGIQALRHRRDDLLPVIHTIWPSVVLRLKDQQPVSTHANIMPESIVVQQLTCLLETDL